jgi:hypothetical protein
MFSAPAPLLLSPPSNRSSLRLLVKANSYGQCLGSQHSRPKYEDLQLDNCSDAQDPLEAGRYRWYNVGTSCWKMLARPM